jgi:hypothetical protein
MKTVRVYYAGIPANNKNPEKEQVLRNFHLGIPHNQSTEVKGMDWQPSDLAVLQGWVHANSGTTPHLQFRRKVIQSQRQIAKHTLAIDSNLFLYRDPGNTNQYLRFSLNNVFPTSGEYFTDHVNPLRWQKIKSDIGFDLKPWRQTGDHILICLQRNGGWSMGGLDVMSWCNSVINRIKKYSNRHIIVRAHPGDKKAKTYLKLHHPNLSISTSQSILDDLKNCWAAITYNSSPGVAAAIEGIPVFVTDPNPRGSQAYDVANTDLSKIETPAMPERQQWIEKISMCHFNFDDLRSGVAWNVIERYL